jgi:L-cysteine desulfhydrase
VALAKEINCKVNEVALVDNSTTGCVMVVQHVMHTQIRSLLTSPPPHPKPCVIIFDVIYAAIRHVITHYLTSVNIETIEVKIPFPLPTSADAANDVILQRFEEGLRSVPRGAICLAILDHISSTPSIVFPVCQLVALCRQYDVANVFIDGAHAIGQIPDLDMERIGADYYTSNIHKWCFGATSCSFIFARGINNGEGDVEGDDSAVHMHHPIVSHLYGQGMARECSWVGTRDYSSMMACKASIEFYHQIGDRIYSELEEDMRIQFDKQSTDGGVAAYPRSHVVAWFNRTKLLAESLKMIASWQTCLGTPSEMVTSLAMVKLPSTFGVKSSNDAVALRAHLRQEFGIECVIVYNHHDGDVYCRLSCQVYNSRDDYDRLREAILRLHNSQYIITQV